MKFHMGPGFSGFGRGKFSGCGIAALIVGGVFLAGMMKHLAIPFILIIAGVLIVLNYTSQRDDKDARSEPKQRRDESYRSNEYRENPKKPVKSRFSNVKDETIRNSLEAADAKLNRIKRFGNEIENNEVKEKINRIANVIDSILIHIQEIPDDYKKTKQFLSYYLDSTEKIIHKYSEIAKSTIKSPQILQSLKKAEALMDTIEEAFKKQLGILHNDEVMKLDVEMEVLEKTLKMEGF